MKFEKSKKFLNISELSIRLNLINKKTGKPSNHILRFWEREFKQIKPLILKGNRRYYNDNQIKIIIFIKYLLKEKGLTIKGVKKVLNAKKNIDDTNITNISSEYFKDNVKSKAKKILKKIKVLKNYG